MIAEEKFLNFTQKYLSHQLTLCSLKSILLSSQYRNQLINLASCVIYSSDTLIAIYALDILEYLSKNEHQIYTIFEHSNTKIINIKINNNFMYK